MKYIIGVLSTLAILFLVLSCRTKNRTQEESNKKEISGFPGKMDKIQINKYIDLSDSTKLPKEVERFYQSRDYRLAWLKKGKINKNGKEFLDELKSSWEEGLPATFYDMTGIEAAASDLERSSAKKSDLPPRLAQLDVLLSKAYLNYASDLSSGRVDPRDLAVIREIYPHKPDLAEYLEDALQKKEIAESLVRLRPGQDQYQLLKKALKQLTQAKSNGGWPVPGYFATLKENDSGPNVVQLKKFLLATGDLRNDAPSYIKSTDFDQQLSLAIKKFQRRHGLEEDGIAGQHTLKEMNRPIDDRIDQIRINLDRLRWRPDDDFGKKYIVINIPAFSFEYHNDGKPVQRMNVVVGRNENYTPVLNDTVDAIVFHPSWNVPSGIAAKEILPKIKADPEYLSNNNYSLLKGSYISPDTINAEDIDWSAMTADNFSFFVVQNPGKMNPLGQVEFLMQNQYNIYLHDTPADYLFSRKQRDFSHGCIRLEKPVLLAKELLADQLSPDSIREIISGKEKKRVNLRDKVPVHLIYQTTWVDQSGRIQFRNDIYDFDKMSLSLFRNTPDKIQTANSR